MLTPSNFDLSVKLLLPVATKDFTCKLPCNYIIILDRSAMKGSRP